MRMSFGYGGWVGLDDIGLPGPLYVRVRTDGDRLRVTEVYLDASDGDHAIAQQHLRELPLSRIETIVNAEPHRGYVLADLEQPAPDLSTLASYFRSGFANWDRQVGQNWVAASFAAQVDRGVAERLGIPKVPRLRRQSRRWQVADGDDFRLPAGGPTDGLTDDFLRDVARAYAAAVSRGERPNQAMAEQTGYPRRSVERWVYTTRLRGMMPRGRRGKVG